MITLKIIGYSIIVILFSSTVWLLYTMTQVEFPGFDPKLFPPLVTLVTSSILGGYIFFLDIEEAKANMSALKIAEYSSVAVTYSSIVWLLYTMSQVEFPGFDPKLYPPLVVLVISTLVGMVIYLRDELKRFGWPVVISSVLSLILTAIIMTFIAYNK